MQNSGGVKGRSQFLIQRVVCEDGFIRFPRIKPDSNDNKKLSLESKRLENNNHNFFNNNSPQYVIKYILGGVVLETREGKKLVLEGASFAPEGKDLNPKLHPDPKAKRPIENELVEEQIKTFAAVYKKLGLEYYNREVNFFGKKNFNRHKVLHVLTVFKNLEKENIPLELFLRSQFELSIKHKYARLLEPSHLSSKNSILRYKKWTNTHFKNENQAHTYYQILNKNTDTYTLKDILLKNHEQYIFLKKHNLTDNEIFKLKTDDFDPIYMIARPDFHSLYAAGQIRVSPKWAEKYDAERKRLAASNLKKCAFLEIVREVCRDEI